MLESGAVQRANAALRLWGLCCARKNILTGWWPIGNWWEKRVQPGLTKNSIARLYAKKELIDEVKISMIEQKTSICFGLGAVDDKKNDLMGHVELVTGAKPGLAAVKSAAGIGQVDQKGVEAIFRAI